MSNEDLINSNTGIECYKKNFESGVAAKKTKMAGKPERCRRIREESDFTASAVGLG
jgi:hypothetical protein